VHTVDALRRGSVDAVVITGPGGEEVRTLQSAEFPYRVLAETMNAGAATLARDGVILYANPHLAAMLAVPRAVLLGESFETFVLPADGPAFRLLLAQAGGDGAQGEVRVRSRDGALLHVHLAARLLAAGDLTAVCLVVTDLSERKAAEEALRRANDELEARVRQRTADLEDQRQLLATVLRQAQDAIVVFNADGTISFANPAAKRLALFDPTGKSVEALQEAWGIGYLPDGKAIPAWQSAVAKALTEGTVTAGREIRVERADHASFHFLVSCGPLLHRKRAFYGAVLTFADITRLKQVETELRTTVADREALLRETRHRLRNNLQLLASLFALQAEEAASPVVGGVMQEMEQRVHAMARVQDSLYLSLTRGSVNLRSYLEELVAALAAAFQRPGIVPRVRVEPLELDVDRAMACGLIVSELVANAYKYAFPAGRQGEIAVEAGMAGAHHILRVSDTGVGLRELPERSGGSSLGLRLVDAFARRLEGTVAVDTTDGVVITVQFPVETS
jgi:PAS domain S-box-containing protein